MQLYLIGILTSAVFKIFLFQQLSDAQIVKVKFMVTAKRPARKVIVKCCGKLRCDPNIISSTTYKNETVTVKSLMTSNRNEYQSIPKETAGTGSMTASSPHNNDIGTETEPINENLPQIQTVSDFDSSSPPGPTVSSVVGTIISKSPQSAAEQSSVYSTSTNVQTTELLEATLTSVTSSTTLSTLEPTSSTNSEKTTTSTNTISTTSTKRTPCQQYQCSSNGNALNSNGQVDILKIQNATNQQACDRLYVFGRNLLSWTEAASYCCSLGMQMLSIETKEELNCISDLMNSPDGTDLPGEYFTSGSDYQNQSSFVWCSANYTPFNSSVVFWSPGEPSTTNLQGTQEDCVSVQLSAGMVNENVLRDVECSAEMKFICEVPAPTTTRPPCLEFSCQKNIELLDQNNFILPNASINGTLRIGCGRMYLFSKYLVNWTDAASKCCLLNMHLAALETPSEVQCFNNIFKMPNYGENLANTYWIGASEGLFTWCTPRRSANIANNRDFFGANEPKTNSTTENCVNSLISSTAGAASIAFKTGKCGDSLRYVCETEACSFPECPNKTCVQDPAKYNLSQTWKSMPGFMFWEHIVFKESF
ncbi:uncharacterized protein LOC132201901 [Neocloeon triangulifer]|uniref:uncharacterized protein LOC132201901 n=1 Tax=Neocloeon triangulifer TaxID=2078957 RepID=UPI00286F0C7E|nr:uncharacterized protein LOC132201901 [Neocloeon triangulifer]